MMKSLESITLIKIIFFVFILCSCNQSDEGAVMEIITPEIQDEEPQAEENHENDPEQEENNSEGNDNLKYLALGDSYTIGQSVCNACSFPNQLGTAYNKESETILNVQIIARTGWRTDNLIQAINQANPDKDYDLVTLLIGVNNQYQGRNFEQYEVEFTQLLNKAIELAGGNKNHVIVLSIPDYAYTPYGQSTSNPEKISEEIDNYNAFAQLTTEAENIIFLNITDITRRGLSEPNLVASDKLHPSEEAYSQFVDRLLPLVKEILAN